MRQRGVVGNEAGWDLKLFTLKGEESILVRGSRDYYAEIEAALPGGLEPGSYSIAIEGITAEDYEVVRDVWARGVPVYACLYLYWRDAQSVAARAAGLAGLSEARITDALGQEQRLDKRTLVAVLRITRFSRRMGARRYEAVLEGHEQVYDLLRNRVTEDAEASTCLEVAAIVAEALGVTVDRAPYEKSKDQPGADTWTVPAGDTGLATLQRLARRMEQMANRYGRGMMLIRDGELYIGPGRSIPLSGSDHELDFASGLIEAEVTGARSTDPQRPVDAGQPLPQRDTYRLQLKGRPDIKPGDVVRVTMPRTGDAPAATPGFTGLGSYAESLPGVASSGDPSRVSIYVTGVMHRLSRTAGFFTTVAGVDMSEQPWDVPTEVERPAPHHGDQSASSRGRVATAIRALTREREDELLGVGQVRAFHVEGNDEPPSQTVSVRRGLAPSDGRPWQARRLPVKPDAKAVLAGVPYVTPFAWGKCGLVLPRYPGTRVVLGHHRGEQDDPIDMGALWESGHGPDDAQAGDWWLHLPAEVPSGKRETLAPDEQAQEPTGKATSDLIDADGNRIIEVGTLIVRIGHSKLKEVGKRPEPPEDAENEVAIEHASGSRIVIKQNGDIVIDSKGELHLSAASTLTLEAEDVDVKVTNAMDVKDR